jgi:acyl-CoA reductase-like NAD-dependent aldehyde dehydrogenase
MARKPDDLQAGLDTLRAAVTDGRTENVRWRQNEFQRLHAALREMVDTICEAISKDASPSMADAQKEFYLTMDAIRHSYETLDFDRLLKEEYSVKDGKDNLERRVGLGLLVIRPTRHTRFYSILTPLAAAIAAGNCVLLEEGPVVLGTWRNEC